MATTGTTTDSKQVAAAATEDVAEEAFKAMVQRAFALGWHVAELRYLPTDPPDPDLRTDPLPSAPNLDLMTRAKLQLAQITADLDWLGLEPTGKVRPFGAVGPPSKANSEEVSELDSITVPASAEVQREPVKGQQGSTAPSFSGSP